MDNSIQLDPKTILVVDDTESIRITLKYSLVKAGYKVLTAPDGGEALKIIHQENIDLVISDISMPVLSGLELVKLIKEFYRPPEILLITGAPSLETATSAIRLGIFDYIAKPVNTDILLTTVHRALEKKALTDEKERLEEQNERYLRNLEDKLGERSYHLLQTEEKYRSLFENSNVGVSVTTLEGHYLEANQRMCQLTGYSPAEIKRITLFDNFVESSTQLELLGLIKEQKSVDNYELERSRSNETSYWASLSIKPITYRSKQALLVTEIDISERKANEIHLKQALADKDEMLREIHHRTKNNMNVVMSLLNMQAHAIDEEGVKTILDRITQRIYSMSLVHEQIYASGDFSSIDLAQYIRALHARHYGLNPHYAKHVKAEMVLDDATIGLSQAVPLGLALNEIIANATKHPFSQRETGHVLITLKNLPSASIQIIIQDDGCGLPNGTNMENPESLGLHMAKILVEDQLDGQFQLIRSDGTIVKVEFPLDSHRNVQND